MIAGHNCGVYDICLAPDQAPVQQQSIGAKPVAMLVHNGINGGLLAACADALNLLEYACSSAEKCLADAWKPQTRCAELYAYCLNLAEIAEAWRDGGVITTWQRDPSASAAPDKSRAEIHAGID